MHLHLSREMGKGLKMRTSKVSENLFQIFIRFTGKPILSLLIFLFSSQITFGQVKDNDFENTFRLIKSNFESYSFGYECLIEATSTIGHRMTGTNNGAKAEMLVFNKLKALGFGQVRYIPFEFTSWERKTAQLEVVPYKSDNYEAIPSVSLANTPLLSAVSAQVVDVSDGLPYSFDEQAGKLNQKVALINLGLENPKSANLPNLHRSEKVSLAMKAGASGVLMVHPFSGEILLTGTASVNEDLTSIPALCISHESGQKIREWIKTEKLMASMAVENITSKKTARSISAILPGKTKPEERILICGHLDSWDLATGAFDNGVGSFSILDMARFFATTGLTTNRSLEFVFFMGEEQGLLGSSEYIKKLSAGNGLDSVKYVINLDMAYNTQGFNAFGHSRGLKFLNQVGKSIQKIDSSYKNNNSSTAGLHSDHQPFLIKGIPVISPNGLLSDSVLHCYHANCDRINLVRKKEMRNCAMHTAMLVYALATVEKLPTKRLNGKKLKKYLEKEQLKEKLLLQKLWEFHD